MFPKYTEQSVPQVYITRPAYYVEVNQDVPNAVMTRPYYNGIGTAQYVPVNVVEVQQQSGELGGSFFFCILLCQCTVWRKKMVPLKRGCP
jgi:hypothetical protein